MQFGYKPVAKLDDKGQRIEFLLQAVAEIPLFYHRFLKTLVAIELKVGSFQPEHAGKMDFYLNLLNEKEQGPVDNPSIGIILCAEKDNLEVEFALKTNLIGVAEYRLTEKLPKELKGKLPSERELRAALLPGTTKDD